MPSKRTIPRTCQQCGDTFLAPEHNVRRGQGKYCSRKCVYQSFAKRRIPIEERFWKYVEKTEGCWEWHGFRAKQGYGRMMRDGHVVPSHRVSWELTHGPIPEGLHVCHHCDNPPCVNPDHLFLGTAIDNTRDRQMKGRTARGNRAGARVHPERVPRGEARPASKLTEDQVREIRARYQKGVIGCYKLADIYGVPPSTIRSIVTRKKWTHID